MKAIEYAYDVLRQKVFCTLDFAYTLQVRKYRLNSKNDMITGCIVRVPILSDFSQMPDGYDAFSTRYEQRFSSKLFPDIIMQKLQKILRDRFLQERLNLI